MFSVGLSTAGAGFDIRTQPEDTQALARLLGADVFLEGTKKTLDHLCYGLAIWQLGETYQSIGASSLRSAGKWAAYTVETGATVVSVVFSTYGTAKCMKRGGDPVACATGYGVAGEGFSISTSQMFQSWLGVQYKK